MDDLTKKQQGFVKDYIETGNGVQSALNNYDTTDYNTANQIAVENLQKPTIVKVLNTLADRISDDMLVEKHKELFEQKRIDYFVFPKKMDDDEIVEHVEAQGLTVITVRESDKGKMAFYTLPDAQAIKAGLDMGYKLKGAYAPVKSVSLNLNGELIPNQELEELAKQLNAIARGNNRESVSGDGVNPNAVDTEIQD